MNSFKDLLIFSSLPQPGQLRMVVFEHLLSQAGDYFFNRLPQLLKDVPILKAFKTRLKRFLAFQGF